MGNDPATSVADPWGELHDVTGVWIGDASAFPTASGHEPDADDDGARAPDGGGDRRGLTSGSDPGVARTASAKEGEGSPGGVGFPGGALPWTAPGCTGQDSAVSQPLS